MQVEKFGQTPNVENEDLYKGLMQHLEKVLLILPLKPDKIQELYAKYREITDIQVLAQKLAEVQTQLQQQVRNSPLRAMSLLELTSQDAYTALAMEVNLSFEAEIIQFLIKANANRKNIPGDFSTGLEKNLEAFTNLTE